MAESKRRGEHAVNEHLDEVFDDAVDEAPEDEDLDSRGRSVAVRRAGTATKARSATTGRQVRTKVEEHPGVFERLARFFREIVAELRKVIWPTRKELLTYTTVVVVFVAVILTVVGLLDLGFAKLVLLVFGGSGK